LTICRPTDHQSTCTLMSVMVRNCTVSHRSASVKPCTCCLWHLLLLTDWRSSALLVHYCIILFCQILFTLLLLCSWHCLVICCMFNSFYRPEKTVGRFIFWISLSLRLLLSPKFGLRPKISQEVKSFFLFGLSNLLSISLTPNFGPISK